MNIRGKNEELYKIVPDNQGEPSSAAVFCRILAVITWIGGLIVAIATSFTLNKYGDSVFSFAMFLSSAVIYAIAGGALFCVAELLENVQSIANSLKGMKVLGEAAPQPQEDSAPAPVASAPGASTALGQKVVQQAPKLNSGSSHIDNRLKALQDEGVEFVDSNALGALGLRMVDLGMFVKMNVYAPEGMSEAEAKKNGYTSWMLVDGKRIHWKIERHVPNISEERLNEILGQHA